MCVYGKLEIEILVWAKTSQHFVIVVMFDFESVILVSLSSAEHASQLLSSAKKLRRSANALIKDNVYINAHLTKGQAAAAYQLRCQKRQTRAQRVGQQSATASCATSDGSSATDNSSANIFS